MATCIFYPHFMCESETRDLLVWTLGNPSNVYPPYQFASLKKMTGVLSVESRRDIIMLFKSFGRIFCLYFFNVLCFRNTRRSVNLAKCHVHTKLMAAQRR